MSKRRVPSDKEMQGLWAEKASITFEDIIHWKDEIGLKRGVLFDEDGTVLFEEWPIRPHDAIIDEFGLQFSNQLRHPYRHPTFRNHGTEGTDLFLTEIDVIDVWLPGLKRLPDAAFVPVPRPNMNTLHAAIVKTQPILGHPFPTLILEVGNSQTCPNILQIRDRALSYLTGINVFVTVVYNRNKYRTSDSWYMEVAVRDYLAPQPPPGTQNTYPPCVLLFETAKVNGRYPLVNNRVSAANNNHLWPLPMHHLYHPQPVPTLNPPLPAQFDIDIESIRSCIETNRLP
jgi:hypothetical protein